MRSSGWILLGILAPPPASTTPDETPGRIEVVESVPIETDLDLADLRDTPIVWAEMIDAARDRVGIETFYFSERPDRAGPLRAVLDRLEVAAGRGVRIRMLSDAGFDRKYPETLDRLENVPGFEVRVFDARTLWGGTLHTKCFAVDGEELFLGSQNWDWRALEHIHELGVRIRDRELTARLESVLDLDWALASGERAPPGEASPPAPPVRLLTDAGDTVSVELAASPPRALPPGVPWDEPRLVALLDSARADLIVHLLSYNPRTRDDEAWSTVPGAIERAAARGVSVRILLSDWSKRPHLVEHVQQLASVPNVEVRFTTIPPWSGGFIPYARVEHPKYAVADDARCWIGTSNWSRGYFHDSRNVSLFVTGRGVADDVRRFFEGSWTSSYAETVDPEREYEAPRIAR